MITIVITEDERKARASLMKMFAEAGYGFCAHTTEPDAVRLVQKNSIRDLAFIKDTVIELENSMFDEKKGVLYKSVLEAVEKPLIEQTLKRTDGNQLKAARLLGLNRNTIRAKIKKLGIQVGQWKII